MLEIRKFEDDHIEEASKLFIDSYESRRKEFPLIPRRENIKKEIEESFIKNRAEAGVAAFQDDEMVGYIIENARADDFMGEKTAFSLGIYSHSSVEKRKKVIYQKMYERLSKIWVEEGYHSHIFSLWAQDEELTYNFFRLGFGMTHFELLRDLSDLDITHNSLSFRRLEDREPIEDLDKEHNKFYPKAPLFWLPPNDHADNDEIDGEIIAAFQKDEPVGYIHLKKDDAETWLLTDERTCRIAGAYVDIHHRGKGIGKALLQKSVEWAEEKDLKRLYVEGESANIYGGNFWMKHFTPVVYTVRRCIDKRL
ncbi:MAG: GNAT family N-acetyltransferase [Candidatus Aenigmatarchaeota archaeon]